MWRLDAAVLALFDSLRPPRLCGQATAARACSALFEPACRQYLRSQCHARLAFS